MNSKIAKERISYVARPDSITTSEGDFLATHVAIKKLKVLEKFDIAPTGGKSFSEEDIFKKYILNPEDRHQFIAIYGQSGTGKSHLIRWFAARYEQSKPKDEVVLFIRRSDNTLKGTIRQGMEEELSYIKNDKHSRLIAYMAKLSGDENLFYTILDGVGLQKKIRMNPYWRKFLLQNFSVIQRDEWSKSYRRFCEDVSCKRLAGSET